MSEFEKGCAHIMYKLIGKNNWNACYDLLEHFKRFQNLDKCIKELSKKGWIINHKKPNYYAISLNAQYKKEIVEFVEDNLPELKGLIK